MKKTKFVFFFPWIFSEFFFEESSQSGDDHLIPPLQTLRPQLRQLPRHRRPIFAGEHHRRTPRFLGTSSLRRRRRFLPEDQVQFSPLAFRNIHYLSFGCRFGSSLVGLLNGVVLRSRRRDARVRAEPFGLHVIGFAPRRDVHAFLLQALPRRLRRDGDDLEQPVGFSDEDRRQTL